MSFKKIIMENLDKSKITKLRVWDFDGTLMDTLEADTGKEIWKEKTGTDWPYKGWWGRKESLDLNVFDFQPKPEVIEDYNAGLAEENTLNVMLTGRRPKLGDEVKAILDANGLKFDRYMYNYGADTLSNKLEQMAKLLKEFPNIKSLEQWDDRDSHVVTFKQWGNGLVEKGRLEAYNFTHVLNENWTK